VTWIGPCERRTVTWSRHEDRRGGVRHSARRAGAAGIRLTQHAGEKEGTHSPPLSIYSAPGGLRQDPGRAAEWLAEAS
jgi:hypothetical protein